MADAIDKVLGTFEGLIRRSIAPSVTFVVLFAAGELVAAELAGESWVQALKRWVEAVDWSVVAESTGFFTVLALVVVLGLGYGLSSLQQILFDNLLKASFNPGWLLCRLSASARSEDAALEELRGRALERLDDGQELPRLAGLETRTDLVLYEVLGGIDPVSTRSFVDSAKSIGVVICSAIAVVLWNVLSRWPLEQTWWLLIAAGAWVAYLGIASRHAGSGGPRFAALGAVTFVAAVLVAAVAALSPCIDLSMEWWREVGQVALLILLVLLLWWLGREATLAQYRQRSLRHYANFLMMPPERLAGRLLRPDEASFPAIPGKEPEA